MKKGSVFGGMLLIAGSCIGVGMLGLPILTGFAGFFPTLIMTFLAFVFMTTTAIYLIEVGSWFPINANLSTQISALLGPFWRSLAWMLYLFLFYSLLVAYISLSGIHFSSFIETFFEKKIQPWTGSVCFVMLFGSIVYKGTKTVDHLNRYLMAGKIIAFALLMILGVSYIKSENLVHSDSKFIFFSLPILVISFGFHNMIPALNSYLDGNKKKVRKAILGGATITFFVYILWQALAIGILPIEGSCGIKESFKQGIDASQAIKSYIGNPYLGTIGQFLALFAILTSFLAQTLSLTHFLSDGLKNTTSNKWFFSLLSLIPPLLCAVSYPNIFYDALNFAGGICAVILFGLIPAMMLYNGKKEKKRLNYYVKFSIILVLVFSLFILSNQITVLLNIKLFSQP